MSISRRALISGLVAVTIVHAGPCLADDRTAVLVIPTLHKRLLNNPRYNYRDLYRIVAGFRPQRIGVEIRQEDLLRPAAYLRANYPQEMVDLAQLYADRVFGFDWLGDELIGRAVPARYWTEGSSIRRLERQMNAADFNGTARTRRLAARVEQLGNEQERIAAHSTAAMLADGRYDRVTADYYRTVKALASGTAYSAVPAWYARRDREIAANIIGELKANVGMRTAIVTGADHHGPVIAALSRYPLQLRLEPVRI